MTETTNSEGPSPAAEFKAKIAYRKPADLKVDPENARKHPDRQINLLARAIRDNGFLIPLVVDGEGMVIAGHGRLLAARQLEIDKVPVVVADHLSAEQRRRFQIADNKLAELSSWDRKTLADQVREIRDLGYDATLIGFTPADLSGLLGVSQTSAANGAGASGSDKPPTKAVTYQVPNEAVAEVEAALKTAKEIDPDAKTNGQALAVLARAFNMAQGTDARPAA
jgi:ParB-like chromosome segregation protein Spo0J